MSYKRTTLANIEDLYKELETGPGGLSDQEADRRLLKIGPNVLPKGKKTNLGVVVSAGAIFWAFNIWRGGGRALGNNATLDPILYARGTTVVMAGIMIGQLRNLFSARSSSRSAFQQSPLRNQWLLPGILALFAIMAVIIYVPLPQPLFGTAPLLPSDWLFLLLLAPMALLLEELRKMLARRRFNAR